MHDLAVVSLAMYEEVECPSGKCEVSIAVHRIQGKQRVASEEPPEARAGRIGGFVISGYQSCFAVVFDLHLINGHFCPFQSFIDAAIGGIRSQSVIEEMCVVVLRQRVELGNSSI